jgi:hypothetical protein
MILGRVIYLLAIRWNGEEYGITAGTMVGTFFALLFGAGLAVLAGWGIFALVTWADTVVLWIIGAALAIIGGGVWSALHAYRVLYLEPRSRPSRR